MGSFNHVIEETDKPKALALLAALQTEGRIGSAVATGMKAIIESLPGTQVSIAFNGSDDPSGYVYASWNSHSVIKDVPTDEERQLPNEPGWDHNEPPQWHPEWAGVRTAKMAERLGRQPVL